MSDNSDEETMETKRRDTSQNRNGPDWRFLKTPRGYVQLINMLMALITMCIVTSWLGARHDSFLNFSAYAATHTWVAILVIIILRIVRAPACCSVLNWTLMYLINSAIFVVIMSIGSIIILIKFIAFVHDCSYYNCATLAVAFVFGMITTIGCLLQCRFQYQDWKAE